jgi:hypothetical protein
VSAAAMGLVAPHYRLHGRGPSVNSFAFLIICSTLTRVLKGSIDQIAASLHRAHIPFKNLANLKI